MIVCERRGHSFKMLVSYLVEPKEGQSLEKGRLRRMVAVKNMEEWGVKTSREVAKVMAHYAQENVRKGLMKAANVRGWTRALNMEKPTVLHLSFSPPSSTKPEKKVICEFVHQGLSALDGHNGKTLADHQYAMFLHEDTDNWHVHVVVNLIDHHTGRLADPYRTQQKLQRWANEWCIERGLDVCSDRQKKYANINDNKKLLELRGERYWNNNGYVNLNGHCYHIYKRRKSQRVHPRAVTSEFYKKRIVTLKRTTVLNYERRRQEKEALYQLMRADKSRICAVYAPRVKAAAELRKSAGFFTVDALQCQERKLFFRYEDGWGILVNAGWLAWEKRGDGFWRHYVRYLLNKKSRRIDFFKNQYKVRCNLPRVQVERNAWDEHIVRLDREYKKSLKQLQKNHHAEINKEKLDWRDINELRFRKDPVHGHSHQYRPVTQRHAGTDGQHHLEYNFLFDDEDIEGPTVPATTPGF